MKAADLEIPKHFLEYPSLLTKEAYTMIDAMKLAELLMVASFMESEDENNRCDQLLVGRGGTDNDDIGPDWADAYERSGRRNGGVPSLFPASDVEE